MQHDMTFAAAQADMRSAYAGGAPGIAVSGSVWLIAGVVASYRSPREAALALLVGGMLIHPLAVVLTRITGRSGVHSKGNPLGQLAMEGTVWMLMAIALAYGLSLWRIELFFPAMLMIIGGRYLTFATLYGMRAYWAFSATLAAGAWLLTQSAASAATGALTGGAIEIVFALIVYANLRSSLPLPTHGA